MPRIAVVNGICVKHDAISSSVRDDVLILNGHGFDAKLLAYACEFPEIPFRRVDGLAELLTDGFYRTADLIIFHFGVFYELFNAVAVGNGSCKTAVRHHNVTPSRFLAKDALHITERSLKQQFSIAFADSVWPVSIQNARDLSAIGIEESRIKLLPLVASASPNRVEKTSSTGVEALFVGRCVPSKGVADLIMAAEHHLKRGLVRRLTIIGSSRFADRSYQAQIQKEIKSRQLGAFVDMVYDASDSALDAAYDAADILVLPSYHEGFCMPVIEALSRGVIPITYDSYNLKYIAEGLSVTVPAGDIGALSLRIGTLASELAIAKNDQGAQVRVDLGKITLSEFRREASNMVEKYTKSAVSALLISHVSELLS